MAYECIREGDAWLFAFPDHGVGLALDALSENRRDGIRAEITIQLLDQQGLAGGHVHGPAAFNLTSTSGRQNLIRYLATRDGMIPWTDLLEVACARCSREWRAGSPAVDLSTVVVPPGSRHLIYPLLPANETTILYGPGGSQKSTIALATAVAVAAGLLLPGMRPPDSPAHVGYLDWESNEVEHAERLQWLSAGLGLAEPPHIMYRQMFRGIADDVSAVKALRDRLKLDYIIYDSLAGACAGDLNDGEVAVRTLSAMRQVGGTRLVIAHVNAEAAASHNGSSKPYGSIFFVNYGRSLWEVRAGEDNTPEGDESERVVGLFHRKVNRGRLHRPISLAVCWLAGGSVRLIPVDLGADPTVAAHSSLNHRIRELLRRKGRTVAWLAEQLDSTPKSIDGTLRRMSDVQTIGPPVRGVETVWGLRSYG